MPKVPSAIRKAILEALLTSKARKQLYKGVAEDIERIVTHPAVDKAYVAGSFASKKQVPGDIDLLIKHRARISSPEGEDFFKQFRPYMSDPMVGGGGKSKLQLMEIWPGMGFKREISYAKKKYGRDYKLKRILGLGGLATAGALSQTEEAEAMPSFKQIKGAVSSAAKVLKGQTVNGKIVEDVMSGAGGLRKVVFEDGTHAVFSTEDIRKLCSGVGTNVKMKQFQEAGAIARRGQALRSLVTRYERSPMRFDSRSPFTTDTRERMTQQTIQFLKKEAPEQFREDIEYVRTTDAGLKAIGSEIGEHKIGRHGIFPMPRPYVDELEKLGLVERIPSRTKRIYK